MCAGCSVLPSVTTTKRPSDSQDVSTEVHLDKPAAAVALSGRFVSLSASPADLEEKLLCRKQAEGRQEAAQGGGTG